MKCETKFCRNSAAKGRRVCYKCRSRQWKEKYPFRYHFNALRNNARRRGIPFDLSFDVYRALYRDHPIASKDKLLSDTNARYEIDRIDVRKGYTDTNVQLIEKQRNIQKYHEFDKFILEVNWQPKAELSVGEAPF